VQVFTLTAPDAASSLLLVRQGVPVGEQLAPPVAAQRRRNSRRLQQQQAGAAGSADAEASDWAKLPDLPDGNEELQVQLEQELLQNLRTGQHATSALAGVRVDRMKHKHGGAAAGAAGGMGHQHG
jgi:hypothetical protein